MTLLRAWLTLLLTAALLLSSPSVQAADDIPQEARVLFAEGRAAILKKDWPAAERALAEAWNVHRSYDIAALLSQTEEKNGHLGQAAEHIDYSLRHFPPKDADQEAHQRIRNAFRRLRAQLVAVDVNVDRLGAEVFVDDQLRGKTPLDGFLYLAPGRHRIEARLNGMTMTQVVDADVGEMRRVSLTLDAPAPPAVPPAPEEGKPGFPLAIAADAQALSRREKASAGHPERLPLLVTGGILTAAAVGMGVYFGTSSNDVKDEHGDRDLSTAFFITGGAVATTTAVYAILTRQRVRKPPVMPVVSGSFVGIASDFSF